MNPERWRQIEDVLQDAIDRPRQERASFLDEACEGDVELREETTSLLNAFEEADEFMEQPAIAVDARVLAEASPDLNIGRAIGPYKIIKRLGAGGMGEVYLAEDSRLGRLVALKILPSSFVFDQNRLGRFQREARAASALNHPNIFTIHEVAEYEGVHCIATEFIDGQTLNEVSAARTLSIKEILDIAVQIASALAAAHAAGIVHRDIKPENIMLREDGIIKVLDFGIAKLTEQSALESSSEASIFVNAQTETGVVMGTPSYMSPEQARGFVVDEGTDIWSLGVVLYELVARQAPFTRATRLDTLVAILEHESPPLSQFVSGRSGELLKLQKIVNRALRKERNERYETAAEMLAELNALKQDLDLAAMLNERTRVDSPHISSILQSKIDSNLSTTPLSVVPSSSTSSWPQPELKPARRRPVIVLIVTVLLMTAIGGTLLYRWNTSNPVTITPSVKPPVTSSTKLYTQMNQDEQLAFIREQEHRVSAMMGDRPVQLNDEALGAIKERVDWYVSRLGAVAIEPGKEDLRVIYSRATPFVPLIKSSFTARKVPVIIGIYLPMIESEYKTCFENQSGAKGLYQFIPQTAKAYGVSKDEMCDVDKMTPAAAHYIADRMAELGEDAQSMTLVLLSYNAGADGVRDALRELRNTENFERNFWTLFANRQKLNERFQNEGAHYVPSFFAAAIIGENPQAFGLQMSALSSLNG